MKVRRGSWNQIQRNKLWTGITDKDKLQSKSLNEWNSFQGKGICRWEMHRNKRKPFVMDVLHHSFASHGGSGWNRKRRMESIIMFLLFRMVCFVWITSLKWNKPMMKRQTVWNLILMILESKAGNLTASLKHLQEWEGIAFDQQTDREGDENPCLWFKRKQSTQQIPWMEWRRKKELKKEQKITGWGSWRNSRWR